MEEIDYERLRSDLISFFGSATPVFQLAYADVIRVERASDEELVEIALSNGFDLEDYITYVPSR